MKHLQAFFVVLSLSCAVIAAGCGEHDPLGRRAVSGTVVFDSKPLEQGSISFEPIENGVTSSGEVIQQGKYSIHKSQGLPPGKYRVIINAIKPGTGMTLPEGKMPGDEVGTPPQELIPPEWNSKSVHTIEVTESSVNDFTHDIRTNN